MPCIVLLIALAAPRLAIVLVVVFGDYIGRAYDTTIVPLLGFFFAPVTTLAYAWSMNAYGGVQGLGLVAVVIGALMDVGALRSASRHRQTAQD